MKKLFYANLNAAEENVKFFIDFLYIWKITAILEMGSNIYSGFICIPQ